MKQLFILSDTHIPKRSPKIPKEFTELIKDSDITVHAGDFETKEIYKQIKELSNNFYGVKGNCDRFELPQSQKFKVKENKIGLYHGSGINPRGHKPTLQKIAVRDLDVDILIHGHTHNQETVKFEDKIFLNPGSATGVGGGSSRAGNPKAMIAQFSKAILEVKSLEKKDNLVITKEKQFKF